jgi:hypothetical protein
MEVQMVAALQINQTGTVVIEIDEITGIWSLMMLVMNKGVEKQTSVSEAATPPV